MARVQFFSTFDLARGFYQVPLEETGRDKTTFLTPFGKFRFKVMPFGLWNAPATSQRLMDCILGELNEFTNVYIDDISVFSANWNDHLKHLNLVLTCLKEEGLTMQAAKSQLGMNTCKFLRHVVGKGGTEQVKTRAVEEFWQPLNKSDVRAFLGLVGYYRKFIPAFSSTAAPPHRPNKEILSRHCQLDARMWTILHQAEAVTVQPASTESTRL